MKRYGLGLLLAVLGTALQAAPPPVSSAGDSARDPLDSPVWQTMRARYFGTAPLLFDERIHVLMPNAAENALAVPVEIRAELAEVEQILVIADLNPIPEVLDYLPQHAQPAIAFRFKVEQSTPVRAAVRTADGIWHLGGAWLTAGGGGCTAPSQGTRTGLWQDHLGEVAVRRWPESQDRSHLKLRVIHPMDTGLAAGIPAFHIDQLDFKDDSGAPLAQLKVYEPVSENPVFDVWLNSRAAVDINGVDTNGNRIAARVSP